MYPLVWGLSVLVVASFSTAVLGEFLTPLQYLGLALMAAALLSLVFLRGNGLAAPHSPKAVFFPCLTGLAIAAYTLIDGLGVRQSGSAPGYAMWLFVLQGILLPVTCFILSPQRKGFGRNLKRYWHPGAAGGLMSLVAYAIVVWAQNAAPLALVSALRETSVLLAGIIGFIFFKEKFNALRLAITLLAVGGIAALHAG